jgi:hypothetical protein
MLKTDDIIFDFLCSETYRAFEAEINRETFQGIRSFKRTWTPLNEEDFINKPLGLKIIEYFIGVSFIPYPREEGENQRKPKPEIKGIPFL